MPVERIAALIRGELAESFGALALELFRAHWEGHRPFRALCDERGASPETVTEWRQVPPLPAAALAGDAPGAAGRELARLALERSFPAAFLPGPGRPPLLCLAPPAARSGGAGVGLLTDWALTAWAAPDSLDAAARRGVEVARARSFLGARQRDRRATVLLGTTAALGRLLSALDRRGLRFRLPGGSRVVVADGGEPPGAALLAALAEGLAVPADAVLREYAPAGSATRLYAGHGRQGEPRPFVAPPWARARVLDPATLDEAPAGAVGAVALFDLARPGPPAHLLTGDRGVAVDGGFVLAASVP